MFISHGGVGLLVGVVMMCDIAMAERPSYQQTFAFSQNWQGAQTTPELLNLLRGANEAEYRTIQLPNLPEGARPLRLVRIRAGSFVMGSPDTERGRWEGEDPVHTVNIGDDFYLGETELTQAQWLAVMGSWPGTAPSENYGLGDDYPAYNLSWTDCQDFITALNALGQGTFRLPSEAEWEYACRAGTSTRFSFGAALECADDGSFCALADQYMWWRGNNRPGGSKPVATKLANPWGLYDMHGNVWEWCQDWYHANYTEAPDDGSAWEFPVPTVPARMLRSGGWFYFAGNCRAAFRFNGAPEIRCDDRGVRLAARVQ